MDAKTETLYESKTKVSVERARAADSIAANPKKCSLKNKKLQLRLSSALNKKAMTIKAKLASPCKSIGEFHTIRAAVVAKIKIIIQATLKNDSSGAILGSLSVLYQLIFFYPVRECHHHL